METINTFSSFLLLLQLYDYTVRARATTHAGKACACLPEDHARGIYHQIVVGLSHMHSCFVVHSDLVRF